MHIHNSSSINDTNSNIKGLIKPSYLLLDKFNSEKGSDTDIVEVLSKHFSHHKWEGDGGSMFNITRKMARFLLYNLKHTLPLEEDKIKSMWIFSKILAKSGIKGSFPKTPIIIDTSTNSVVEGTSRLLALALGRAHGTYFEIELI